MDIFQMINEGQIDFEAFMKMHPYSASNKNVYMPALEGIDFFDAFHIKTIDMYVRLAEISNVLATGLRNLVIITGYRGCGKTNFLRYIEHIAKGGTISNTLIDVKEIQMNYIDDPSEIENKYEMAKQNIYTSLKGVIDEHDIDGKKMTQYLEESIRSRTVYLNFDVGGLQKEKPLSHKLYLLLEDKLKAVVQNGQSIQIVKMIDSFVERNRSIIIQNFEEYDRMELAQFWRNATVVFGAARQDTSRIFDILRLMQNISLEHLLLVYFIWEFCHQAVCNSGREVEKSLYLMDNIDLISDREGVVFKNTINGILSYIYNSRNMFSMILEKSNDAEDEKICKYYQSTNIIIAMRETTVMKITDHYRKVIRQNLKNFDISEDIDKSLILKRKLDYAIDLISIGRITNSLFIRKIKNLEWLLKDNILMQRISLLNNNDVRTTIQLLSELCMFNFSKINRRNERIKNGNDQVFGMRGIVYKEIFRIFNRTNYFRDLRINDKNNTAQTFPYSAARIILIMLYKQREKQLDRLIFSDAEYVELKTLFSEVEAFMSKSEFEEILDSMYAFRDGEYWNHLVTFDNVLKYTKEDISKYLDEDLCRDDDKVYICITSAGKTFLDSVCVHFEYFSERYYAGKGKALFELNSLTNDIDRRTAKSIIRSVFEAVRECCKALRKYNHTVLSIERCHHYSEILTKPYNYESTFHEERLIHNHIAYLNAYRNYLISKMNESNTIALININKYITRYIKQYLDLLHTNNLTPRSYMDVFLSRRSKNLYNSLMVCVEEFEKTSNWDIDFTTDYYNDNYQDRKCKAFQERNI